MSTTNTAPIEIEVVDTAAPPPAAATKAPSPSSTPSAPPSSGSTSPARPSSATKAAGKGPGNNWNQPIAYRDVIGKPEDFDPSRPPNDSARMGFLKNGDPWSPYGTTAQGKIRTRPAPTLRGRDPGGVPAASERRLDPKNQKAPEDVKALYAALDDTHNRQRQLVAEIRSRHPESKLGPAIHPKETGDGTIARMSTDLGPEMIADGLKAVTNTIARRLGPESKPSEKAIIKASEKIDAAAKFYGLDASPKGQATFAAVVALILVFLPAILIALDRVLERFTGKHHTPPVAPRLAAPRTEV